MTDENNKDMKLDENNVEYYAPDLGNAKPIKGIHDDEEDVDDFETQLDTRVLFERVAKELYKYPESAIRELLVNAMGHGCRKANELYGEDNKAYVDIHLHPHDRKLIISDVRGMGMSHNHIKSLMSYVGRSGNADSKTAGQFGMGYFSHLKISDSCMIHTKVREAYEYKGKMVTSMSYLNNRGWQWQKTNTSDEDVDIEEPGTKLELTLNNEIDIYSVIRTIKEVARYSDIIVQLTLDDDFGKMSAGKIEIEQTSDLALVHEDHEEQETIILDDEEIYFKAIMYKNRWGQMAHDDQSVILLARVPITVDSGLVPAFSGYILNIKDERKYKPLPDRESMQSKSEKMLKEKLETLFKEHFGKLTATTAEELEAMPYKYPVLFMNNLGISRFFTQGTKDFIHSVVDYSTAHIMYDENKHLTEYGSPHSMHQVLAYRKDAILVHNKTVAPIRAVQEWCTANNVTQKKFLRIDKKTSVIAISLMEQWNIPKIKDFMKLKGIKAGKSGNSRSAAGLTVHFANGYRDTKKITDFDDIDYSKMVFIKGPLKPWMYALNNAYTDLEFTKWNKKAVEYGEENEEPIITEATLYGMEDFEIITSKGKTTFNEWYKDAKALLHHQGNNYQNTLDVFNDPTNEVTNNPEQVNYTLEQSNTDVSRYSEDAKFVNNSGILLQKTINIHDTQGNEIELDVEKNFTFLSTAYRLIDNDDEIKESINEQISEGLVQIPYTEDNLECDEIFDHSPFYGINLTTSIDNKGDLKSSSSWKVYSLELKDYFGIPNKYSDAYGWEENFDVITATKKALDKAFETEDIRQLLLNVISRTDYSEYASAIKLGQLKASKATEEFVEKLKTIIPEIDINDGFDVFFKTRHIANSLKDVNQVAKTMSINSSIGSLLLEIKNAFNDVNRKARITGHLEKFLEEFVTGAEAKVKELRNEVTVTCKPQSFIYIKALVELHTKMELAEVHPHEAMLKLRFIPHKDVGLNTDVDVRDRWASTQKHCPCGCENKIEEKIYRANDEDDDD